MSEWVEVSRKKNNVINFSLINSVSELFQNNNINASIKETKQFIEKVYQKKEKERFLIIWL